MPASPNSQKTKMTPYSFKRPHLIPQIRWQNRCHLMKIPILKICQKSIWNLNKKWSNYYLANSAKLTTKIQLQNVKLQATVHFLIGKLDVVHLALRESNENYKNLRFENSIKIIAWPATIASFWKLLFLLSCI